MSDLSWVDSGMSRGPLLAAVLSVSEVGATKVLPNAQGPRNAFNTQATPLSQGYIFHILD